MSKQKRFNFIAFTLSIVFCVSSCTSAPLFETQTPADAESTLDSTTLAVPTLTFTPPVVVSTDTPVSTYIPPTNTSLPGCIELLTKGPWILDGKANGDAQPAPEEYMGIENLLQGKSVLQIRINLHGATFGEGHLKDESAIVIDQPDGQWTVASVVTHKIENGKDGEQTIYIPLSDFVGINSDGTTRSILDLNREYGPLHARFWNRQDFVVEIPSIMACSS